MDDKDFHYKNEVAEATVKKIGELIKTQIPKNYAFTFFLVDEGDTGGIFYTSSMTRESFLKLMEEFLPNLKS